MAPARKKRRLSIENATPKPNGISPIEAQLTSDTTTPPTPPPAKSRSLFVRSLPATATTQSLLDYFSQSFPVKHATAIIDPSTKACKGYGFVTFAEAEDADLARAELDGTAFEGRRIKLEAAAPRHRELAETAAGPRSRTAVQSAAALEARARRAAERQQGASPRKLIVRNLPWSVREPDELAALFRSYGKVKLAAVPKKKDGLLAGFGFVIVRGRKNAERALEGVNGKVVDGRTLAVDWAVDKEAWASQSGLAAEDGDLNGELPDADGEESQFEDFSDGQDDASVDGNSESDLSDNEELEVDEDLDEEGSDSDDEAEDYSSTVFVRNLPYTASDDTLRDQFTQFGPVRYARVVLNAATERPKGTGFVCFYNGTDAMACLRAAPKSSVIQKDSKSKKSDANGSLSSVLQNEYSDPSGSFTMEGRVLQVSQAVNKSEATKLTETRAAQWSARDGDRRRLYLLSEGTISSNSPLYNMLSPSEIAMRDASAKQRKTIIQSNPSLHLSLTRLSIRNIPRSVTSKDLKALAREAVVEFAKDVKSNLRQPLSKEELARGGDEMVLAEKDRKRKGTGIVKQAKVVFEGREGGKVPEESGAGRSRGYGFVEYHTHRAALMGLRWLNGHAVKPIEQTGGSSARASANSGERKKRLIVEFAIENAQVVNRRKEREHQVRDAPKKSGAKDGKGQSEQKTGKFKSNRMTEKIGKGAPQNTQTKTASPSKRKLDSDDAKVDQKSPNGEKLAKRNRIIERKRMKRRVGRKGKHSA